MRRGIPPSRFAPECAQLHGDGMGCGAVVGLAPASRDPDTRARARVGLPQAASGSTTARPRARAASARRASWVRTVIGSRGSSNSVAVARWIASRDFNSPVKAQARSMTSSPMSRSSTPSTEALTRRASKPSRCAARAWPGEPCPRGPCAHTRTPRDGSGRSGRWANSSRSQHEDTGRPLHTLQGDVTTRGGKNDAIDAEAARARRLGRGAADALTPPGR